MEHVTHSFLPIIILRPARHQHDLVFKPSFTDVYNRDLIIHRPLVNADMTWGMEGVVEGYMKEPSMMMFLSGYDVDDVFRKQGRGRREEESGRIIASERRFILR